MEIRIRDAEGCESQPFLLWDTVWVQDPLPLSSPQGGFGDWDLADPDEPQNQGGLRAKAALHTAIILCLFTDARAPDDLDLGLDVSDRRGWWGNSVDVRDDLFEEEMGSLLWTLERGTLSFETEILARDYTAAALQTLIDQGAVASFDITAEARPIDGFLGLDIAAFARDGDILFDQKFDLIWR